MKLTNQEIIQLAGHPPMSIVGALHEVTGRYHPLTDEAGKVVRDANNQVMFDVEPYTLGTGARMGIALMLMKLRPIADTFEKVRQDFIKDAKVAAAKLPDEQAMFRDMSVQPGHPLYPALNEQILELMATPVEVPRLNKIKVEDLNIDSNKIPVDLLIRLARVLVMPDEAEEETGPVVRITKG